MQILLLATDEYSTLDPLTGNRPGCLLPIANRPVMERTLEVLARAGYKDILVSLYQRGGQIAAYFGSGSRWGVRLTYVSQQEAWGSAGSLKWASNLLTDTVLVLPAHAIIDLDIDAALAFHRQHGGPATMIIQASGYRGQILVKSDTNGRVTQIGTNLAHTTLSPTGAYIFEPTVLAHLAANQQASCEADLIPALLAAEVPVFGYQMAGYWNPLDTMRAYYDAQQVYLYSAYRQAYGNLVGNEGPTQQVRYPTMTGRQMAPGIWVGINTIIHPSAQLASPLCIDEHCLIDRDVELGPGSVLGAGSIVDNGATLYHSTVLDHTYIGQLVNLEHRIVQANHLIDPVSGDITTMVDPFLLAPALPNTQVGSTLWQWFNQLVAACLFIAALPLLLPLGLLALLSSGKLLQRERRVGQRYVKADGTTGLRQFNLLMLPTRRANGRLTVIGTWLERNEFQRLPELINVMQGDMALVGVKPITPIEARQLTEEWHQRRHDYQPGFTGLWYVQANEADLDSIVVNDVYYAATRTWRGDLRLLTQTPRTWAKLRSQRTIRYNTSSMHDYGKPSDTLGNTRQEESAA